VTEGGAAGAPGTGGAPPATGVALAPTARAIGVAAGFLALIALGVTSTATGVVVLAGSFGAVLLVAPVMAWRRAVRTTGALRLTAHPDPALVAVGGRCVVGVTGRNGSARRLPPVAFELPAARWRRVRAQPAAVVGQPPKRRRLAPTTPALVGLPGLSPGETVEHRVPVPTGRRGVVEMPPLSVWVHDPMGLFGALVGATAPVRVTVHPVASGRSRSLPALSGVVPADGGPVLAGVAPGAGTEGGTGELADFRPYVPGDRLHLVHWPALARHDQLVVRQFLPEVAATAHVVLDDRAGAHRRAHFEEAVGAIQALAEGALDAGAMVELGTLSGRRVTLAPTVDGRAALWSTLADLWPVPLPSGSPDAHRPYPTGTTLVTTPTGASTLPGVRWRPTVVVVP